MSALKWTYASQCLKAAYKGHRLKMSVQLGSGGTWDGFVDGKMVGNCDSEADLERALIARVDTLRPRKA